MDEGLIQINADLPDAARADAEASGRTVDQQIGLGARIGRSVALAPGGSAITGLLMHASAYDQLSPEEQQAARAEITDGLERRLAELTIEDVIPENATAHVVSDEYGNPVVRHRSPQPPSDRQ